MLNVKPLNQLPAGLFPSPTRQTSSIANYTTGTILCTISTVDNSFPLYYLRFYLQSSIFWGIL